MKKEYKRLEIHVKNSTIQEKAEAKCIESVSYFDKEDIISINRQSTQIYNRNTIDATLDNYLMERGITLYTINFILGETIKNVILSDEQLKYLCED